MRLIPGINSTSQEARVANHEARTECGIVWLRIRNPVI
jgi:hypothetical protein